MLRKVIKNDDKLYLVCRILNENTSEEQAVWIHNSMGTDALLRDRDGKWFCCVTPKDVEFRDLEKIETDNKDSYDHTGFELQDNGGMG